MHWIQCIRTSEEQAKESGSMLRGILSSGGILPNPPHPPSDNIYPLLLSRLPVVNAHMNFIPFIIPIIVFYFALVCPLWLCK